MPLQTPRSQRVQALRRDSSVVVPGPSRRAVHQPVASTLPLAVKIHSGQRSTVRSLEAGTTPVHFRFRAGRALSEDRRR